MDILQKRESSLSVKSLIPGPSSFDVVGVGAATLDDLWLVPSFSDQEHVSQACAYAQMGGGPVATALCVLSSLGHSTALLDIVGDDCAGGTIREDLKKAGVSLAGMNTAANSNSARAVISVREKDGARQISYLPSNAGELRLKHEQLELVKKARLLHINGRHESAARQAVQAALASGIPVSFDGGAGRYRDSIRDLVEQSQIRIVSQDFARRFSGSDDMDVAIRSLLMPPVQLVVITDGMNGSHIVSPNGARFHQKAYPASPLVDTTGCGDVYHGAFLHGYLERWPLEKCSDFASRLAALNAEGLGGRWVCQKMTMNL